MAPPVVPEDDNGIGYYDTTAPGQLVLCSGRQSCVDFENEAYTSSARVTVIEEFTMFVRGKLSPTLSSGMLLVKDGIPPRLPELGSASFDYIGAIQKRLEITANATSNYTTSYSQRTALGLIEETTKITLTVEKGVIPLSFLPCYCSFGLDKSVPAEVAPDVFATEQMTQKRVRAKYAEFFRSVTCDVPVNLFVDVSYRASAAVSLRCDGMNMMSEVSCVSLPT